MKFLVFLVCSISLGQTIDWTQIKASNRLGSGTMGQSVTMGIGASRPNCGANIGEQYYTTDAVDGQNLYVCTASGWKQQNIATSGPGAACVGGCYATIQVGGTSQTQQSTLNFIAGSGVTASCVNNAGANRTDCTFSYNSGLLETIAAFQAGNGNFCKSTNGTPNYTCSFIGSGSAALTVYTLGMRIFINPDTASTTSASVAIDNIQIPTSVTLKRSDCTTDVGTDIKANGMIQFWYNGTVFCEMLPTQ